MDKTNDFEFCMLVHDLSEAAKGNSVDKENLLARLSSIEMNELDEANKFRVLAAMQRADDKTFQVLCQSILTTVAGYSPQKYNPLNAATHDLLVIKRQELAKLEKEVENLELIEKYRELKALRKADGKIGDEFLDNELDMLEHWFNPDAYDDNDE